MDVLESLVDEEFRLEFLLIEALHEEAERLAAPAVPSSGWPDRPSR
ncbi:hypothetical protein ACFHYQ_22255 [Sphaerimonospora cavernae]|uniref:Uncharacterized protein n=1 Tax=Sphaerimonospora cavernae TaxID=1740611 RepID=A0ABV6UA07_9ACTN